MANKFEFEFESYGQECNAGVSNQGGIPQREILAFRENWGHRLGDPNCWHVDLLAGLAEVIQIVV